MTQAISLHAGFHRADPRRTRAGHRHVALSQFRFSCRGSGAGFARHMTITEKAALLLCQWNTKSAYQDAQGNFFKGRIALQDGVRVEVTIAEIGAGAGDRVIQIYIRGEVSSVQGRVGRLDGVIALPIGSQLDDIVSRRGETHSASNIDSLQSLRQCVGVGRSAADRIFGTTRSKFETDYEKNFSRRSLPAQSSGAEETA